MPPAEKSAAVLVIGDEILSGRTQDTNTNYIARFLAALGIDLKEVRVVGDVKLKAMRLLEITYEAMMRGIQAVRPGATTGDIGHAIQAYAEGEEKCSVVRDFCGHGLGRIFHSLPNIVHYGKPGGGMALRPGMFFTIEPMINLGGFGVKVLSDGWTAVTRDRSLSAQFEHSCGVTDTGVEIFTLSPKGWHKPPYL